MGLARVRFMIGLGFLVLVATACGGGDDTTAESAPSASTPGTDGQEDVPAATESSSEPVAQDAETSGGETEGERSATITIDGETMTYAVDDVVFSNVEGMDDMTFETCSPDFFGSGRFYAIGYAVGDGGEVLVAEDGGPTGTFSMDLPPDDWEAAERDEPEFEIKLNGLDIEIASPEEAAGGTMAWTVDDTTASGSAVFVDFDNTYTVEFDLVCEGSPTVNVEDLPVDSGDGGDTDDGGGFPLAGAGVGSFTADGESFEQVAVYRCEPFSFGSDPDPRDLSLLAFLGGFNGLEVEASYSQGFDRTDGSEFDKINLSIDYSRDGANGVEQFEGSAETGASGAWFVTNNETFELIELDVAAMTTEGDTITGGLAGLEQTWPDEGAATVDVTFDLEIPSEVNEEC